MWTFLVNPPKAKGGKKKGGRKVATTTREGRKYKSLVKKLGVTKGAKEYRKWKREQKAKKKPSKARAKGGKRMAKKKSKGAPTTARGRKYRALVKKHGVQKAAKMWRRMPASKKGGKKKYAANPKGRSKTAKGRSYRALVKKHGVQKAASLWRARGHKPAKKRSYAANAWKRDKRGHSIASTAGWARRKGVPVPIYLSQRGFSKAAIDRYIGKHGAVGSSHRPVTKTYPLARGRRYAMNPMAGAMETVKGVFQVETVKTVLGVGIGFMGMAVGNAIVKRLKADAKTPLVMAGEVGGSILAGAVYAVATKDVGKGLLTASSGIALSIFKFAWTKWVAGNKYLGLTMPGLSDYVELPYTAGLNDYVELPYAAGYGMGQSLDTGMGQFLPPEAAEVGQLIPEQFGEYTVGIGEEAEVEY